MSTPDRDDLLSRLDVLERSRNCWRRAAWAFAVAFLLAVVTGAYVGGFYYSSAEQSHERAERAVSDAQQRRDEAKAIKLRAESTKALLVWIASNPQATKKEKR